jgi:RNA-directed DNA polymerase
VHVGEMQKKLSQWATEDADRKITDLYSLLCNAEWLRVAHRHVNANQGRETAGIDGETMQRFNENLEANLETLRALLKAKAFEPVPVNRMYIPKPDGRKRPLGILTIRDRIVQEALRMILEPIWEAHFSNRSYGFRPNRSTYDAIAYLSNRLADYQGQGFQWVIEGDIASYFDTIPQRRLIKAIKKKVADRDIRALLWKFLRAGVMYRGIRTDTLTGTPQGGIVSPLAANIYLDQLDKYMESKYLHLTKGARARRRKQGKGNYLYARYADDFVVLCNGTKAEAQSMKEELHHVLNGMGLTLSEEKTKITHITEGFQFLGYRIERSRGETGKMVPKVLIPASAVTRFRHKVREMLAPSTSQESLSAKIHALNSLIRGWCNYYRCTSSPSKIFGKLSHEIYWDMVHWLGRKYQVNTPTVLRRYLKRHNTFGTATKTLVMPRDIKAKKRLVRTWHNPYTGIERIEREHLFSYTTLWTGDEHDRPGAMDLREEMMLLKGTRCAIQGSDCTSHGKPLHPSEVEMDHIIPRAKFKDPTEADRMGNLQPTCTPCHRAKTQTDSQVLRRMR